MLLKKQKALETTNKKKYGGPKDIEMRKRINYCILYFITKEQFLYYKVISNYIISSDKKPLIRLFNKMSHFGY